MERIQKRFVELAEMAEAIVASQSQKAVRKASTVQYMGKPTEYYNENVPTLDVSQFVEWQTSVLSLLERVFGESSSTYRLFNETVRIEFANIQQKHRELHAIFRSAQSDYQGGYLFDVRNLVHAEVFADELQQAEHFLELDYKVPAAVIAGTVLESTLREMCSQHPEIEPPNGLNRMNDALAREGVYNKMRASQIRTWAKIRNAAAHGEPDEFGNADVEGMIAGIRDFVATRMVG